MSLKSLVDSIKNFEGLTRKKNIKDVTTLLGDSYKAGGRTVLSFGDDASALDIGNDKVVLLAADGMWGKLMEADPFWAGYCSVLVNVNDIAAMGGIPLGMTNVISTPDPEICRQIMEGIRAGVEKFGVPMVGGHVHPDTPYNALDVSITGIIGRNDLIISGGARPGDQILVAIDLDGKTHPQFKLNWDTTTMKSPQLVQNQIKAMNQLAQKHLVTAGRDISNPGTIGTLGMLLESSGVGGTVELEKIPRNPSVNWEDWLKLYPGAGFVLTLKSENVLETKSILEEVNITCEVVGEILTDNKLFLTDDDKTETVFDFQKDSIMGVKEEIS
ncbi:MAG TPA: methanogenesis marker 2 protein [Methanobacteriaceae archaeon]|nr:methanogenesis marker 2 protein [Methanobacteriaceae archaeon]